MNQTTMERPFSYWWIIGTFLASIVLYGIAGGLFSQGYCDSNYNCPSSTYNGGIALSAFGSIASLAWVILLIVFLVKRRTKVHWSPVTGLVNRQNFAPYQNPPMAQHAQAEREPVATEVQAEMGGKRHANAGGGYCGNCGNHVTTPFCSRCGFRAENV